MYKFFSVNNKEFNFKININFYILKKKIIIISKFCSILKIYIQKIYI